MVHDGWIDDGHGWWRKVASDGTWLVWNESWGGNRHTHHCHVSGDNAQCTYRNFKPSKLALKALKAELDKR